MADQTETKNTGNPRVAVYGSLRKGLHNHGFLRDATFLGEEQLSQSERFRMVSLGAFPALIKATPTEATEITVEVYEITSDILAHLDALEGYPNFYDREKVDTTHGRAWAYFTPADSYGGRTKVPSGDWMEHWTSKKTA